jgi:hypothetical protein
MKVELNAGTDYKMNWRFSQVETWKSWMEWHSKTSRNWFNIRASSKNIQKHWSNVEKHWQTLKYIGAFVIILLHIVFSCIFSCCSGFWLFFIVYHCTDIIIRAISLCKCPIKPNFPTGSPNLQQSLTTNCLIQSRLGFASTFSFMLILLCPFHG